MTGLAQGQVFWIDFGPRQGSAPSGRRPCVVVQSDLVNRSRIGTTVVCAITSNLRLGEAPGNILLQHGEGGLPRPSVINVSQILTLDKAELTELIGQLSPARIREIQAGLGIILG